MLLLTVHETYHTLIWVAAANQLEAILDAQTGALCRVAVGPGMIAGAARIRADCTRAAGGPCGGVIVHQNNYQSSHIPISLVLRVTASPLRITHLQPSDPSLWALRLFLPLTNHIPVIMPKLKGQGGWSGFHICKNKFFKGLNAFNYLILVCLRLPEVFFLFFSVFVKFIIYICLFKPYALYVSGGSSTCWAGVGSCTAERARRGTCGEEQDGADPELQSWAIITREPSCLKIHDTSMIST